MRFGRRPPCPARRFTIARRKPANDGRTWYWEASRKPPRLDARKVGDVMTRRPITIAPGASIAQACRLLHEHRLRRLPVVEGDKLVGMIARADLVRAVAVSAEEVFAGADARCQRRGAPGRTGTADLAQPRTGDKAVLTILVGFLRCGVRCIGTTQSMIRSIP